MPDTGGYWFYQKLQFNTRFRYNVLYLFRNIDFSSAIRSIEFQQSLSAHHRRRPQLCEMVAVRSRVISREIHYCLEDRRSAYVSHLATAKAITSLQCLLRSRSKHTATTSNSTSQPASRSTRLCLLKALQANGICEEIGTSCRADLQVTDLLPPPLVGAVVVVRVSDSYRKVAGSTDTRSTGSNFQQVANLLACSGQLSLLLSAGREMSSSYGYGVKAI